MLSSVAGMQADVFDVGSWRDQLQGAVGVISCLGAFGSNDFMQKICGDSNITVFEEAAKAGVPRAAFISVHDYNLPGEQMLSMVCINLYCSILIAAYTVACGEHETETLSEDSPFLVSSMSVHMACRRCVAWILPGQAEG